MTLPPNEVHAAALDVIRDKLARGVAHVEVEMILNGQPGTHIYSIEELGQIRDRVLVLFRAYIEAIRPEVLA